METRRKPTSSFRLTAFLAFLWWTLTLSNGARFVHELAERGGDMGGWAYLYAMLCALAVTCAAHWTGKLVRRGN
jgi:hypothetical protein